MNKLAILVFVAFLLIVSSSFAASLQKSTTAAKTCSPELFKEKPGLCAAIYALAHNKESSASAEKRAAEKPSKTSTIISAPIEVKKGPTMEQKKASAGECPAGRAKDCAGICFPLKECKASISAQPATCTQSEEEKTSAMMTAEKLGLKSLPHLRILCQRIQTKTRSGNSLCLTPRAMPNLSYAYQAGWQGARDGQNSYGACVGSKVIKIPEGVLKDCIAGWHAYKDSAAVNNAEKAVPEQNCKGQAGTNNGIGSAYARCLKP